MAHFAQLDSNDVVLRVIVVDTKDNSTADGVEKESIGQAFCERLLGGNWIQTSYNNNMRVRYAGIGYSYDSTLDAFIPPKPYPSWVLSPATVNWDAPVPYPTDGKAYYWDEKTLSWVLVDPQP